MTRYCYSITCGRCKTRRNPQEKPNCSCEPLKRSKVFNIPNVSIFNAHTTTAFNGDEIRVTGRREQDQLCSEFDCALPGDFKRNRVQERIDRKKEATGENIAAEFIDTKEVLNAAKRTS